MVALILAGFAVVLAVLAVWLGRPRLGGRTAVGSAPDGSGRGAGEDDGG